MANSPYLEEDPAPAATKRTRWATQRMKKGQGSRKRVSIIDRLNKANQSEKKRDSGGSIPPDPDHDVEEHDGSEHSGEGENGDMPRSVFVNMPLPSQYLDENGHPSRSYKRNKIRTAKYTPLSFIPKNLYYQFHNIANIYFLFMIILTVSYSWRCTLRQDLQANRVTDLSNLWWC